MAQNIKDTVITQTIDQITAVTKGYVGAYTTVEEEDLFSILVRGENPDDLSTGTSYFETTDTLLTNGTAYFGIWATIMQWLTSRAAASGSSGIDGLLTDRHLRVPHTFDKYIYYPSYGSHITTASIFPDKYWDDTTATWVTYSLGTYAHDDSTPHALTPDTMDVSITDFWGVAAVTTVAGIGGANFTFVVDVTYADASTPHNTGTETVDVPTLSAQNTVWDIGAQVLAAYSATTISAAGQKKVYINTPANFAAGQKVIIWTGQYHALLTADYLGSSVAASAQIYIRPEDAGAFNAGDSCTILDDSVGASAAHIILHINYETGLVTFTANLPASDYTVANNTLIFKTVADTVGDCEEHVIDTVTTGGTGYLTLLTNLQHTYVGTSCKAVRLLTSINHVDSHSAGTTGDAVEFQPKLERVIVQGSIL